MWLYILRLEQNRLNHGGGERIKMAKLVRGKKVISVKDGESITAACEQLGVPFGCYEGKCGSCKVKVEEEENLSEKTEEEECMGLPPGHRLACQCKIKQGVVILSV